MRITAVVVICALLASKVASATPDSPSAPSFDCARAATPVEHLICDNPELSRLDTALADSFRAARESQDEAERATSLQEQRQWLQSRHDICAVPIKGDIDPSKAKDEAACLVKLYTDRIAALKTAPKTPVSAVAMKQASFDKTIFAATGTNEAILTVPSFGRYAIAVKSNQGTAIQLIDKMAGPGDIEGSAGHVDGRIDAFLDQGKYKVKLFADPHGSGDAELAVVPAIEQEETARQLVEFKPVDTDLGDHQQRSYWLNITTARPVAIEAAGRYLDTLSLWRDGKWLVDATATASVADPSSGQPLAVRQISTTLPPGLYRLTAYGGSGQKWADGGDAKPLHIRFGLPTLAEAGRTHLVASATGIDRFLVPASATYFRLDIDKPDHAAISVQAYNANASFEPGSNRATIDKTSRDPFAEVFTTQGTAGSFTLVTIERQPGAAYQLTWFDDRQERTVLAVNAGDTGWIATYNTGSPVDQLDPTLVITDPKDHVIASTALKINKAISWKRQFNLLGESSLYVEATEPVDLSVEGSGADAEYRMVPLIAKENSGPPPDEPSGYVWKLDPGFYRLNIRPKENGKGVLSLALHTSGTPAPTSDAPHQAAAMVQTRFAVDGNYSVYGNIQADTHSGLRVYASPIDIQPGISFEMSGGQTLTLPVSAAKDGRISATSEDGAILPISIDKAAANNNATLIHGKHDITFTLPAGEPRYVAVTFVANDLQSDTALPVIDAKLLSGIPDFPVLAENKPAYPDLAKQPQASFAVSVVAPALYRLESTGIIETAGDLRTRVVTELDNETANGIGRNFLIQRYLSQGDYQVTVKPSGTSAGPVGVTLSKTPLLTFGTLTPDLTARATLPPSNAGLYIFHIDKPGNYSLKTLGLGHDFTVRLEDKNGWPLLPPGGVADITYDFVPGDYRLIVLPGAVENRAVTTLHRNEKPVERTGHGPFALTLSDDEQNRWLEPAKGEPRTPDAWIFTLPAPATVTITIDSGMQAALSGKDKVEGRTAIPGKDWTGLLPAGDYQLAVTSAAPNNRVNYTLNVSAKELVAGSRRAVTAPIDIPISIGNGAPVEINSYGSADVRATLYDAAGKIVAANDDRDNDWNFSIAGAFVAGQYKLHIDPVGSDSATTEVAIEQPVETQDPASKLDKPATISDELVHVVPIDTLAAGGLLIVEAQSDSPVGIALEELQEGGLWKTAGTTAGMNPFIGLPLDDKPPTLRARIWSRDHNTTPIRYTITDAQPKTVDEAAILKGSVLAPIAALDNRIAALHVTRKGRGVLFVDSATKSLQWSIQPGEATGHKAKGQIGGDGNDIWLIDRSAKDRPTIKLQSRDPKAGPVSLTIPIDGHGLVVPSEPAAEGSAVLWKVESRGIGQAAVSADGGDARLLAFGGPETTRVGITVAINKGNGVRLWQPEQSSHTPDLPATLSRYDFKLPDARPLTAQVTDGVFVGHDAARFTLAGGTKTLSLNLPEGAAAVLTKDSKIVSTIWSWRSRVFEVPTDAEGLTLLYTGTAKAAYSVGAQNDAIGTNYFEHHNSEGTLVLDYTAGAAPSRAYGLGAVDDMTVIGDNGTAITRGLTAMIGGDRQPIHAFIDYHAGSMDYEAALDRNLGDNTKAIDLAADKTQPIPIAPIRISAGPARLVRVKVDQAAILYQGANQDQGIPPQLLEAGSDYFLLMPEGQSRDLMAYPAKAAGTMTISVLATTPISEGIGPKRRIAPGEARAFSFVLPEARTVGVGVRASVDIANCYVVGPDGTQQGGDGKLVMANLPAGTNIMVVDVPSNGEPVEIEPALVGSVLPGNGPPNDVKAQYLATVNGKNKQ